VDGNELKIKEVAEKFFSLLGIQGNVVVRAEGDVIHISFHTEENSGMLIGKGGETLRALQHLLLLIVSKETGTYFSPGTFSVDINDYQKEREQHLRAVVQHTADEVRRTGREQILLPMSPSERRLVHLAIEGERGVRSESVGERQERRVVIRPVEEIRNPNIETRKI
jgi:spoIIIJ-associated protein